MERIKSNSYLSFILNKEVFSANVEFVTEVLELGHVTKVPKTSPLFRGIVNLRGDVIPVISLRHRLNMPIVEDDIRTVIIVFEILKNKKWMKIGCVADNVKEVLQIEENEILQVPDIASNYDTDLLCGMKKHNDQFIMILNCNSLFNMENNNYSII
jgi:purine-binding chemotaxis protein CheW